MDVLITEPRDCISDLDGEALDSLTTSLLLGPLPFSSVEVPGGVRLMKWLPQELVRATTSVGRVTLKLQACLNTNESQSELDDVE